MPTRTFHVFGFNLYSGLAIAAFTDIGTAWDDAGFSDNAIGGGGIGLRLFVPFVNMIRLDFAFGDGHAHGLIGINEKAVAARNRVR
jgi:outer membrane translocation and assembly module TamA